MLKSEWDLVAKSYKAYIGELLHCFAIIARNGSLPDDSVRGAIRVLPQLVISTIHEAARCGLSLDRLTGIMRRDALTFLAMGEAEGAYLPSVLTSPSSQERPGFAKKYFRSIRCE